MEGRQIVGAGELTLMVDHPWTSNGNGNTMAMIMAPPPKVL